MSNRLYSSRLDPAPKSTANVSSGGTSLCVLLTVLFVGLKLTGFIDWSWWWVTAPMWIGALATLAIFLVVLLGFFLVLIVGGIASAITAIFKK